MQFPAAVRLGANLTRWPLSELESYEADRAGRDIAPRSPDNEIYLSDVQVAKRYSVSRNTIWRWARGSGVPA